MQHDHRPTSKGAYLLSEAHSRSSVKGEEYKWIRQEILPQSVIEEPVRVEYEGCEMRQKCLRKQPAMNKPNAN